MPAPAPLPPSSGPLGFASCSVEGPERRRPCRGGRSPAARGSPRVPLKAAPPAGASPPRGAPRSRCRPARRLRGVRRRDPLRQSAGGHTRDTTPVRSCIRGLSSPSGAAFSSSPRAPLPGPGLAKGSGRDPASVPPGLSRTCGARGSPPEGRTAPARGAPGTRQPGRAAPAEAAGGEQRGFRQRTRT